MLNRLVILTLTVFALFFTLTACVSKPQTQQPPTPPEPEQTRLVVPNGWLQIETYPILTNKLVMDDETIKSLGLQRAKLATQTLVFNHYRELGRDRKGGWRHEILPAGTEVAVDRDGRAWYKLDCSNRLYAPVERERTVTQPPAKPGSGNGDWSPWWLLLPAGLLVVLLWLLWRRTTTKDDPDANPMAWALEDPKPTTTATAAGAAAATTAATAAKPDGSRPDTTNDPPYPTRLDSIERDVAGIKEVLTGLEDRVVTRLEPTVRAAAEDGGRERARAALAERILQETDPALADSLLQVFQKLG